MFLTQIVLKITISKLQIVVQFNISYVIHMSIVCTCMTFVCTRMSILLIYQMRTVHGKTTYKWHTDDIPVHTSDIRMTYKWHASTYEWHADDIRVHASDMRVHKDDLRVHRSNIRMTYEYIRVTHEWHASIYEWHMDDIRVHKSDIRMTYMYMRADDMRFERKIKLTF